MAEQSDVEAFLEHAGVKGMKWGVRKAPDSTPSRRAQNRALNKQSRATDKVANKAKSKTEADAQRKKVLSARDRIESGKTRADWNNAKAQYKKDKVEKGSREARKALNEAATKRMKDLTDAKEFADGKEAFNRLMVGDPFELAVLDWKV